MIKTGDIELFATCPPAVAGQEGVAYLERVLEVARWSERSGCRGILVYTDNSQLDPWLLAQLIVQNTRALCPLVAVQPAYMHPYTVAKMVATIGHLHGRRLYLNLVAGGFRNDLAALSDTTPHNGRYDRLVEYALIVKRLLAGVEPVSFEGRYYKVDKLRLAPRLPAELYPGIFVSGSSPAGMTAARAIGATPIRYPGPSAGCVKAADGLAGGVRIGILSRERDAEAWSQAQARFPEDRKGQLTRELANTVSDSAWHSQLAEMAQAVPESTPYWLAPFQRYQTSCPYLVGDYARVGRELSTYMNLGYRTYILDVPAAAEELVHTRKAFDYALEENAACRMRCTNG